MHKLIHQPHDKLIKTTLSDPRVARDFFTAHLPKALLEQIDLSTLVLQKQSFIDPRYRGYEADVIYQAQLTEGNILIYSLLEHQTEPDPWLPLRILGYQWQLLEESHKKQPEQPLPIIYSLIIYTGEKPYTYSTDFFDLFGKGKTLAKIYWLEAIPLIDVCRQSDDVIEQRRWFGLVELVFKYRHQQAFSAFLDRFMRWLQEWEQQGGRDLSKAVLYYVMSEFEQGDVNALLSKAERYFSDELKEETMTIAQQLEQRGIHKGLQLGREEGREESLRIIANKLLAKGASLEEINELTGLTIETIQQLRQQIPFFLNLLLFLTLFISGMPVTILFFANISN